MESGQRLWVRNLFSGLITLSVQCTRLISEVNGLRFTSVYRVRVCVRVSAHIHEFLYLTCNFSMFSFFSSFLLFALVRRTKFIILEHPMHIICRMMISIYALMRWYLFISWCTLVMCSHWRRFMIFVLVSLSIGMLLYVVFVLPSMWHVDSIFSLCV